MYSYYGCVANRAERGAHTVQPHRAPHMSAPWLEETVWADVRRFLENPGEVLERVREQLEGEDATEELEQRHEDLSRRLAAKQAEKDRYVHLYAQGHISEDDLETYLTDVKNQTGNLRLLLESVETEIVGRSTRRQLAESTAAWLATLRERIHEVEGDSEEAYQARRRLVRLLVERITIGRDTVEGRPKVEITYRFAPPESAGEDSVFVPGVQNSCGNLAAKRKPSGTTSRHFSTVERRGVP
jgi:hypothetical protein